jgi:hypothetical protein
MTRISRRAVPLAVLLALAACGPKSPAGPAPAATECTAADSTRAFVVVPEGKEAEVRRDLAAAGLGTAANGLALPGRSPGMRLVNAPTIQRLLAQNYPPALRDNHIQAEVTVAGHMDARGQMQETVFLRGDPRFAESALIVVRAMQFSTPVYQGRCMAPWVVIPLSTVTG